MSYRDVMNEWLRFHNHRGPQWSATDLLKLLLDYLDSGPHPTPHAFRQFLGSKAVTRDDQMADWPADMIGRQLAAMVHRRREA